MPVHLGPGDEELFATPAPGLLREVTGLEPARGGLHVLLGEHLGTQCVQRLALAEYGGGIVAAMWPAELQAQARYLYGGGRSAALIVATLGAGWTAVGSPHLGFRNSRAPQRLYLEVQRAVDQYARRWETHDAGMIREYQPDEVRRHLWPWLKERGYASSSDDGVLEQFLRVLGRRGAHLRPALRLHRRWDADSVGVLSRLDALPSAIRREVNVVLAAADEPLLEAS